jgi:hypothetical protein
MSPGRRPDPRRRRLALARIIRPVSTLSAWRPRMRSAEGSADCVLLAQHLSQMLGVPVGASVEEISSAFKKLALRGALRDPVCWRGANDLLAAHPDKGGDACGTARRRRSDNRSR